MRHVLIMAGGSGTRLWPLSRQGKPKQLLDLLGGPTLLRLAFERVLGVVEPSNVWVCAGATYLDDVAEQLPEVPSANLLGEPVGRDSLNAVAWSMAEILQQDSDASVAVVTADQIISPVEAFQKALTTAFDLVADSPSDLVTFGVVPTSPHTGYGYLHRGAELEQNPGCNIVAEFVEKPDEARAQSYLDSGEYWWNSGMFVWRADTWLEQLKLLMPETHEAVIGLAAGETKIEEVYPNLEKTSVDYAVMEPVSRGEASARVVAVPLLIQWVDLGGYESLYEELTHDSAGNATRGPVVQLDAQNNLLINLTDGDSVLAVAGMRDTVVVVTPGATLVIPLSESQKVKQLVERVRDEVSPELA